MQFELVDIHQNTAHYVVTGNYSLDLAQKGLTSLFSDAISKGATRLLIDIRQKKGAIPSFDRFLLGEQISELVNSQIRIAIIGKPDQISKFSEDVAVNRGSSVLVTGDEQEAREWLDDGDLIRRPPRG